MKIEGFWWGNYFSTIELEWHLRQAQWFHSNKTYHVGLENKILRWMKT